MSLKRLQDDYERLFENDKSYDVIIISGENEELQAHSNILRFRSQYFYDELIKDNVEKRGGRFILKIPNIPPHLFKIILRFMYCGRIDMTKLEGIEILKLLNAASALKLQTLVPDIEEYLIQDRHEFLQNHPIEILETIYQQVSFTKLRNFYLEKICDDPEELFNSDRFVSIKAPLLEFILKLDDLSLDEIDIWNSLIKWGLAQNQSIPEDIKKWKNGETIIMERTLNRYIPLVRFHHMSSKDFLEKVLPFKEILPNDLVVTTLANALSPDKKLNNLQPPRQSTFDSILVKSRHFAIFSGWIDKSKYNIKKMPYSFKLLYRASRDGNTSEAFHRKCDDKGANIVVIKIKGTEQIVGGYNPFGWEGNKKHKSTLDSFIFSFVNRANLQSAKVGYIKNDYAQKAVFCHSINGPVFGNILSNDICFYKNNWYAINPSSYPKIDIPKGQFQDDDYEVFQVTKR